MRAQAGAQEPVILMAEHRRLRSPIRWFGGKGNMVARILRLLPSHKQYCEPFFGGGSVFFAKEPCSHETINDIDEAVTTFFRVLRDRGQEFIERAQLTEYNEALFRECKATWRGEEDELVRAWKWWVVARTSFSGYWGSSFSTSRTLSYSRAPAHVANLLACIEQLPEVVERLRHTQIFCTDWQRAVKRTDTPDCLHYLDPPYLPDTRRQGKYQHEMSAEEHEVLVGFLLSGRVKGKVVLSGYANPIYERLERAGWRRVDFPTACWAAAKTQATGILGPGAAKKKQPRIESVWLCPRTQQALVEEGRLQERLVEVDG